MAGFRFFLPGLGLLGFISTRFLSTACVPGFPVTLSGSALHFLESRLSLACRVTRSTAWVDGPRLSSSSACPHPHHRSVHSARESGTRILETKAKLNQIQATAVAWTMWIKTKEGEVS